jgi:bifunctional ADP-heptose synthase (sugar kinase/adenylyltransferase)
MKTITQHKLTAHQIQLIRISLEDADSWTTEADVQAAEALLEVLNERIFGGEQVVLVQYVTGVE